MLIDKITVRDVICARELWERVTGRGCMGAREGEGRWVKRYGMDRDRMRCRCA